MGSFLYCYLMNFSLYFKESTSLHVVLFIIHFVPNLILIMVKIPLPRESSCTPQHFFVISTLFPPLSTNPRLLLVVENITFFFIQILSTFLSHLAYYFIFSCFLFTKTPLIYLPPSFLLSLIFSFFVFH